MLRLLSLLLLLAAIPAGACTAQDAPIDSPAESDVRLIIRIDDLGFNHASNVALKKVLEEGLVTAVSVIVNTPWFDEAADILRAHPEVSVGVHLTLNAEWREYRWGPVLPVSEVPSLVNADGHFFGTRPEFIRKRPAVDEVARELRAQVDLALRKGLDVSYVDYHMGTALSVWEFQQEVEQLARDYEIGISRYFGETDAEPIYRAAPEDKTARGVEIVEALDEPGLYLMVVHPGMDYPEMSVLTDLNAHGPSDMSKHRQGEADMLVSSEFRDAVNRMGIRLVGYKELRDAGLHTMKRPYAAKPFEEAYEEMKLETRPDGSDGY